MEDAPKKGSRKGIAARIVLVALAGLLAFLVALFVYELVSARPAFPRLSPRAWYLAARTHHAPTASDAANIQSWMTFDYLNKVFALPRDLLRTKFGIVDPRYPRLSLARYAEESGVSAASFTNAVRSAVRSELSATPPSQ